MRPEAAEPFIDTEQYQSGMHCPLRFTCCRDSSAIISSRRSTSPSHTRLSDEDIKADEALFVRSNTMGDSNSVRYSSPAPHHALPQIGGLKGSLVRPKTTPAGAQRTGRPESSKHGLLVPAAKDHNDKTQRTPFFL